MGGEKDNRRRERKKRRKSTAKQRGEKEMENFFKKVKKKIRGGEHLKTEAWKRRGSGRGQREQRRR